MDGDRERDEFDRIQLVARITRAQEIIAKYEEGLTFFHQRVADDRYELGRLDERLGGRA